MLELVKVQLRQVGIEALTSFAPPSTLFGQIPPSGDFDAALFAWVSSPGATSKPIFGCGGVQNYTGYCQRLVTADLDQAERILDAAQQARVLNRAADPVGRGALDPPQLRPRAEYAGEPSLERGELVARPLVRAAALTLSLSHLQRMAPRKGLV